MNYSPAIWLRNGHIQTIYASRAAQRGFPLFQREKIPTRDGDFLHLDWAICKKSNELVILSHGLEGHSKRNYITGMVAALQKAGLNCCAWNFRGCSGEANVSKKLYHSGATDDLEEVIHHSLNQGYEKIFLVGFSMGANLQLLYLANQQHTKNIIASVAFSAPCQLEDAALELARPKNILYMRYFLQSLRKKILEKERRFPGEINGDNLDSIKTFAEFDQRYTAPIHGFVSAKEYWQLCSSLPHLAEITTPSLLINALDDPFLPKSCYPSRIKNKNLHSLYPKYGGHVGFVLTGKEYWSEKICRDFLNNYR